MGSQALDLKRGECLTPTSLKLLGNPLDFIDKDYLREHEIY